MKTRLQASKRVVSQSTSSKRNLRKEEKAKLSRGQKKNHEPEHEGIHPVSHRGHFVDHLTSVWLVWLVLISITIGVVKQSRVLHFDHTQYRQRTALRLMLIELCISVGILLALTLLPHAILLNAVGTLFPGPFTHSLIPYICFSVMVMSMSYGIMSESIKGISQVYDAMNQGIRLLSPCFLFYILVMQLYTSILYVME